MSRKKQGSGAGDNASNHPAGEVKQQTNFTAQPEQLALFTVEDAPYLRPAMPNYGTCAHNLLVYLLTGASINQLEWLDMSHGWRLSAVAKALRYLGWCVESVLIRHSSCKRKIAQYVLNREQLRQHQAGSSGVPNV